MLVVANEQAVRVGREGGLAGAAEAEEDGGVLALEIGVGRAVHGGDATQGIEVVHHGEHALLHLAAVPGVDDDLLALLDVEGHYGLGVEAELLVVVALGLGGVEDHEVGLEVLKLLGGGADEHIGDEVCLPGHFHDEAHADAGVGVGAAEAVYDVESLVAELLDGLFLEAVPDFGGDGLVVVLVAVGGPPYGVFGDFVAHQVLVLGGTTGVDAGEDVDGSVGGEDAPLVAFQLGIELVAVQVVVTRVVDDVLDILDAVLRQIDLCHSFNFGLGAAQTVGSADWELGPGRLWFCCVCFFSRSLRSYSYL